MNLTKFVSGYMVWIVVCANAVYTSYDNIISYTEIKLVSLISTEQTKI